MPTFLGPNSEINIDDSGNLAFGSFDIEPWDSGYLALQLSDSVAIAWSKTANEMNIVTNAYLSGPTTWTYRANGMASRIRIIDNIITFYHAVSGLATTTITWEQEMAIENLGNVTIGTTGSNAKVSLQPNEANDAVGVGGILDTFYSSVPNTSTTETDLYALTIKAQTLWFDGQCLRFRAHGITANNANVKTARIKFGATTIGTRILTPSVAGVWSVEGIIIKTSTLTQECHVKWFDQSIMTQERNAISGDNLNTDLVFKITGQGGASSDMHVKGVQVWWDDDPN